MTKKEFDDARVPEHSIPAGPPSSGVARRAKLMAEMDGFDARRGWDLLYSRSRPVGAAGAEERAIVAVLSDLAAGGPALELAVGDGRIAIPLAQTGVEVDGIDISSKGVDQIRAHPHGDAVNAFVADISDFSLGRKYSLIYCVANSLFNLTTQDDQLRCFERVAEHLAPGGAFLVHSSYTPRWFEGLRHGQYVEARGFQLNSIQLQALRVEPAEQLVYQQDVWLSKQGISLIPMVHRYASLAELDLMARNVSLQRREVWGGWNREAYGADSTMCIATYAVTSGTSFTP